MRRHDDVRSHLSQVADLLVSHFHENLNDEVDRFRRVAVNLQHTDKKLNTFLLTPGKTAPPSERILYCDAFCFVTSGVFVKFIQIL